MGENDWRKVFKEAEEQGIGFILLAGGEPFVRREIIQAAGDYSKILFPIFTNGTMMDREYLSLLLKRRNLIPILSIEGNEETTDARRGKGIYKKLTETMKQLHAKGLLFGASVTVTKENEKEVLSDLFIHNLKEAGCSAVIYVEYVAVDHTSETLALGDEERGIMSERLAKLRRQEEEMLFVSFPGDEKSSKGCLAAGRGFFHINAYGGAEPCPFSPYSDTNIRETSLLQALQSPLFTRLQNIGALTKEHIGGCVLFEQEEEVKALAGEAE